MSQKTLQLYEELESFIKEHTNTYGEEKRLIANLQHYDKECRTEGAAQANDSDRARSYGEGSQAGYSKGLDEKVDASYEKGRIDGRKEEERKFFADRMKAYNDGVDDGKKQAQDSIERQKCDAYNRGREDGAHIAQVYEQRAQAAYAKGEVEGYKKGVQVCSDAYNKGVEAGKKSALNMLDEKKLKNITNSLHDLIEESIKKHNGNDEKIVGDIQAHFTKVMSKAQHVTDGKPTRYRAKWLIGLAFMRAIGRDIKEKDSQTAATQKEYALELANELLGVIDKDKRFIIGKKLTGKSGDRVIFDDVIGEALKTKPWNEVEKSLPSYGEPVRVTFDLNDPKGEEDSEYFSVAKLIWHEGADYWEYNARPGGRHPVTCSSVKGWRYLKETDWLDIKFIKPEAGRMVEVQLKLDSGNIEVKNVSVGYDNDLYFDYSKSDWFMGRMCDEYGGAAKVYLKGSVATHWRYI